ncbi:MAG: hypothetical protein HOH74_24200 [Gemmatimonadetes bacterium]|jgi:hypothetical protein|nr:hypothetical protein [Gemmatimonadota bacterium]
MAGDRGAILQARLFGYAILFRARDVAGGYEAVEVDAEEEAQALARELQLHVGEVIGNSDGGPVDELGLSVPFGRCGIEGRPLEHVRIYHAEQAWVDTLGPGEPRSTAVAEGETILVEPGAFVRFRARPRPGRRVLIAFQTEDRSPLAGHAAPLTAAGQTVPTEAGPRLDQTTAVFESLWLDATAAQSRQAELFAHMATAVQNSTEVAAAQQSARDSGSYSVGGAADLFDLARSMLTEEVIERIGAADAALFRFPGMFGAVAPLFPLLDA